MRHRQEEEEVEREKQREEEAQAELDQWAHLFAVEEGGEETAAEMEEAQGMLGEFIDFIKDSKVIEMDELAAHFDLRTQDAIQRVESLLEMGRIEGVMDDRGKFICVTEDEMAAVAKFMNRKGRVSVMDLVVESNKLVDLTPKRKKMEVQLDEEASSAGAAEAAAAN
jgi:DDRGK domain-containing protein 1